MRFMPVLVVCVTSGLFFALIAFFTARYASVALAKGADPTTIEINKWLKISTGNAVVALFIFAVIVATGVPAYLLYLDNSRDDGPIAFEMTHLQPSVATLQIGSRDFGIAQVPRFGLFRSRETQHFKITPTPEFSAIDVDAYYDWPDKLFIVTVDHEKSYKVSVDGIAARLDEPITLRRAQITGRSSVLGVKLSRPRGVTEADLSQPDPAGVPHV